MSPYVTIAASKTSIASTCLFHCNPTALQWRKYTQFNRSRCFFFLPLNQKRWPINAPKQWSFVHHFGETPGQLSLQMS